MLKNLPSESNVGLNLRHNQETEGFTETSQKVLDGWARAGGFRLPCVICLFYLQLPYKMALEGKAPTALLPVNLPSFTDGEGGNLLKITASP